MTTNNPNQTNDSKDTAASFENTPTKTPMRWVLTAAGVAFALFVVAAAGFALTKGPDEAIAADVELTTTTTLAEIEETTTTTVAETADDEEGTDEPVVEEPAVEEDAEEPAPEPEPEPEPTPAQLAIDDAVDVGNTGSGTFTIHNYGDLSLSINTVNAPPTLTFSDFPAVLGGKSSVEIDVTVDTSGFAFGDYELEFDVETSAGTEFVKVNGTKEAFIVELLPFNDVDVEDVVLVAHGNPVAPIKIWNNEDHEVTVSLESLHARLTLPAEYTLQPGVNVVIGTIAPWAVNPASPMNLGFKVSWWMSSEEATVLKIGQ